MSQLSNVCMYTRCTITLWKVHTPFRVAVINITVFSQTNLLYVPMNCKCMQGTAIISFPFISVIYGNLLQIKSCLAYIGGFSKYLEIITNLEEKLSMSVMLYTEMYFVNRKYKSFIVTKPI